MRAIASMLLTLTLMAGALPAQQVTNAPAATNQTRLSLWITGEDPFVYYLAKGLVTYSKHVRAKNDKILLECELLVGQRTSPEKQKTLPKPSKTNQPPAAVTNSTAGATGTNAPGRKPLMAPNDVAKLAYEFEWITADTNVVITINDKNGKSVGTGTHAEYRSEKNTIVLTGNPLAITPQEILTNYDALVYDMVAETFSGVGTKGITMPNPKPEDYQPAKVEPKTTSTAPNSQPAATPVTTTPPPVQPVVVPVAPVTPPKPAVIATPEPPPAAPKPAVTTTTAPPPPSPKPAVTTTTAPVATNTNKAPANKLFSAPPPPLKPAP